MGNEGTNREKDSACMGWMISDALAMLQLVAILSTASGTNPFNNTMSVNLSGLLRRWSTKQGFAVERIGMCLTTLGKEQAYLA